LKEDDEFRGKMKLKAKGPYRFDFSCAFYRRSKFEMVDRYAEKYFMRPLEVSGNPILIRIPYGRGGPLKTLNVHWQAAPGAVNKKELRRTLRLMFCLDWEIEDFYRLRLDPVMRRLVEKYRGFRPILTPNVFEAAAWAIIGQQVNLQFAYRIKSRLVEYVGKRISVDGEKYYLFPSAGDIAGIGYDKLRSMQLSGRKAEYLRDFSRMVADGRLDLESLGGWEYSRAIEKLLSVRGLGPWSANYILMRGAGHIDAFPFGDSGINQAVRKLYRPKDDWSIDDLVKLSDKWRPYRTLAAFYLWKSL